MTHAESYDLKQQRCQYHSVTYELARRENQGSTMGIHTLNRWEEEK